MLKVKKLNPNASLPSVATPGEDVAYDLYAAEGGVIPPGALAKISTGIAIEFVPVGGAVLKCRSGLASKHLSVEGGVIDAGYRGEIIVMIRNHNPGAVMTFERGDRIAQMIPVPVVTEAVEEAEELTPSKRGGKGFGSSGK